MDVAEQYACSIVSSTNLATHEILTTRVYMMERPAGAIFDNCGRSEVDIVFFSSLRQMHRCNIEKVATTDAFAQKRECLYPSFLSSLLTLDSSVVMQPGTD